jgi:hypothetical protein
VEIKTGIDAGATYGDIHMSLEEFEDFKTKNKLNTLLSLYEEKNDVTLFVHKEINEWEPILRKYIPTMIEEAKNFLILAHNSLKFNVIQEPHWDNGITIDLEYHNLEEFMNDEEIIPRKLFRHFEYSKHFTKVSFTIPLKNGGYGEYLM